MWLITSGVDDTDVVLEIRVSRPPLFLVGGLGGTDEGLVEFGFLQQQWSDASAWCCGNSKLLGKDRVIAAVG